VGLACQDALFEDVLPGALEFDRGRSQLQRVRLPRFLQAGDPRLHRQLELARYTHTVIVTIVTSTYSNMGVNATGTLGGRRSSAEDARIEAP